MRCGRESSVRRNGLPAYNRVNGSTGSNRVLRGGAWNNDADNCRVANRNNNGPDNRNNNVGFRPANTALLRVVCFLGKTNG